MRKWLIAGGLAGALALQPCGGGLRAEVTEVRIASQNGIGFLPLMVIEQNHLMERHLEAAGLPSVKVSWSKFGGGNAMNEALLSGSLDIASGGTTVLITLWSKARGSQAVKGIAALDSLPLWFMTRDPNVKRLEDLTDKDKIALTAVKVTVHAMLLEMAAEKIWGPANANRLDALTVGIPHPDAAAALIAGGNEINNHFSAPPYQYKEAKTPGVRRITSNQDILGGPATYLVAYGTEKFRADNPKTYGAFVSALAEAMKYIGDDPHGAARVYHEMTKDSETEDELVEMITDPQAKFTMTPENVMTYADFMFKTGQLKTHPESWKDMFFPEVHGLPGS